MAGDEEIRVELNYERSDVVNSADVVLARPNDGEPTPAQEMTNLTITTTSTLKSGEAAIVSLSSDTEEENSNLLILSAAIVGRGVSE